MKIVCYFELHANEMCSACVKTKRRHLYYLYIYHVENIGPDPKILVEIVQTRMPFGKYKDTLISDIPVSYLEWMHSKGFPPGKLGMMLATVYEIKTNGLGDILFKVKRMVR